MSIVETKIYTKASKELEAEIYKDLEKEEEENENDEEVKLLIANLECLSRKGSPKKKS